VPRTSFAFQKNNRTLALVLVPAGGSVYLPAESPLLSTSTNMQMSESNKHSDYLLGVNRQELERLQFQHSVWGHITRKFLSRLGVQKGWRCLDVGAGPWDRMADIVRAYYRSGGGNAYVAGRIPEMFTRYGLRLVDFTPNCLAGGPTSGVMEWAHRFFTLHIPLMAEKGIISRDEASQLLTDWQAHRHKAETLFFSPLVVDVAGRNQ
jgi:hypothetical protein